MDLVGRKTKEITHVSWVVHNPGVPAAEQVFRLDTLIKLKGGYFAAVAKVETKSLGGGIGLMSITWDNSQGHGGPAADDRYLRGRLQTFWKGISMGNLRNTGVRTVAFPFQNDQEPFIDGSFTAFYSAMKALGCDEEKVVALFSDPKRTAIWKTTEVAVEGKGWVSLAEFYISQNPMCEYRK